MWGIDIRRCIPLCRLTCPATVAHEKQATPRISNVVHQQGASHLFSRDQNQSLTSQRDLVAYNTSPWVGAWEFFNILVASGMLDIIFAILADAV
ncbi:hypothetical protein BV22DRAFT_576287 [Leucogyrophana mollusca]|uniref:Uncharacterized protein n=1 Tax=Leucogyrophana mollusca TaxID=85980 RepID=A0ACB8BFE1_9AGAM|nr:hypothetical protein BV22DRAFT_576287 [Leucogyrophana mollusca]